MAEIHSTETADETEAEALRSRCDNWRARLDAFNSISRAQRTFDDVRERFWHIAGEIDSLEPSDIPLQLALEAIKKHLVTNIRALDRLAVDLGLEGTARDD